MLSTFDFFKVQKEHLVFWLGAGAHVSQQLNVDFLDKVKAFIFVTIKSFFFNCY